MITQTTAQTLACRILDESDLHAWDCFVEGQPQATVYHLSVWRRIVFEAFGKDWYVIAALEDDTIRAGLPCVHMKSWLFGNFLTSMPYVNYGGLLTEDKQYAEPILQRAIELGRQLGVRHLELRHLENVYPHLPSRQEKVSMWFPLPETAQELIQSFKAKLRSQIRKGEKNGLDVKIGSTELLEDFYTVFAHNMRDLGTPVYGRKLFRLILEAFPDTARVVIVTGEGRKPLAGGFLLGYRDRLEIPWASSLREYNYLQSNMWLYWNCLQYACDHGYRVFDFGRSTVASSTYKFKQQWGAQPVSHYWHYHLETGRELPHLNPQNPKFRQLISLWQRLPLSIVRVLGPAISRQLP
jgi:serine/alanine adding enzyme